MRMRSNSLLLMLGKSDLTVFVFSCRVFMWGFWQIWVGFVKGGSLNSVLDSAGLLHKANVGI